MVYNHTKPEPADIQHLVNLLSQIYPVSPELSEAFNEHVFTVKLNPGDFILHQGEICKNMYFIRTGAMMAYSEFQDKKITTYISIENEFTSSLSGLYGQAPSRESILAIEPTVLMGVNTDTLLGWYQRFFELNFIIRTVYENYYRDAQERSFIVRIGSARERYAYFVNSRADAAARLPVEHVASFLDMTPETLIRIRKENQKGTKYDLSKIAERLEEYFIQSEPFKTKMITVSIIAKALQLPEAQISKAVKAHHKLTFTSYINKHRVTYFKKIVSGKKHLQTFTIEALALQAGFISRSGFYKAFNNFEGISPKEYLALTQISNK